MNNKLLVSPEITHVVYFGNSRDAAKKVYNFGPHQIHTVNEYKYLGVWIDKLNMKRQMLESKSRSQIYTTSWLRAVNVTVLIIKSMPNLFRLVC